MENLQLFRIGDSQVKKIESRETLIDKDMHRLIEKNLEVMLNIKYVASEFKFEPGLDDYIDTIGHDNSRIVIVVYKKAFDDNVVGRGIYYYDQFVANTEFVKVELGKNEGLSDIKLVDLSNPLLICMANNFSIYDLHMTSKFNNDLKLVRYRQFDIGFLLLDCINRGGFAQNEVDIGNGLDS